MRVCGSVLQINPQIIPESLQSSLEMYTSNHTKIYYNGSLYAGLNIALNTLSSYAYWLLGKDIPLQHYLKVTGVFCFKAHVSELSFILYACLCVQVSASNSDPALKAELESCLDENLQLQEMLDRKKKELNETQSEWGHRSVHTQLYSSLQEGFVPQPESWLNETSSYCLLICTTYNSLFFLLFLLQADSAAYGQGECWSSG